MNGSIAFTWLPVLSNTDCCGNPDDVWLAVCDRVVVCEAVLDIVCVWLRERVPEPVTDGVCVTDGERVTV